MTAYEIADVTLPGNEGAFDVGSRTPAASIGELAAEHIALLDGPITAVLATTKANGRAQLTPVWVNHDGSHLYLNSVRDRIKDKNLRARPDLTLLLLNPENPYHWLSVEGAVVEVVDEDDAARGHLATESIDALAQVYLGTSPYPFRDPKGEVRVRYKVRPTKIMTFGPVTG